ncbi:MAG: imidazolonepropionase [Candidatus Marinimicrobia bacterium]|nr:imidazolonepropionase [Candidatus Neomarinimicrobiota bacterium]
MSDLLIKNIGELLTVDENGSLETRNEMEVLISDGKIISVGEKGTADSSGEIEVVDAKGSLVTAGLIDPHTHLIFYGTREDEFLMRNSGVPYMEIAEAGGGIRKSVRMLREADEDMLVEAALPHLKTMLEHGTTTVEAKSGYGLSLKDELKSLRAIKRLNEMQPVSIVATFLGAHEIPDEYRDNREKYIEIIINEMIPAVAEERLAEFCDVFAEEGVFTIGESEIILRAAADAGLGLKLHAEEFEPIGGAQLAGRLSAVSADHLVAIDDEGIESLKSAGVTPVLLPGTTFFLGSDVYAPARKMIEKGLKPALATDFNPGSSMTESLQIILTIACLKLKLTPLEAFEGVTLNAAKALNRSASIGSVAAGMNGDIVIWNAQNHKQVPYHYGINNVGSVIIGGSVVY